MTFQETASRKSLPESVTRGSDVLPFPRVDQSRAPRSFTPSHTAAGVWQTPPNPHAGRIELEWFDANLSKLGAYAGLWIAIRGRRKLASSDDLEEILDWLTKEHVVDALVVQVPGDDSQTRYMLA